MPWPLLIPIITAAAGAISSAAKGSAKGREAENVAAQNQNQILANLFGTQQRAALDALTGKSREQLEGAGLDLQRRQFGLNAPSTRAKQSILGSLMANAQPYSIRAPAGIRQGTISGGFNPSMFGSQTRDFGKLLMEKALADQMAGDTFDPLEKTDWQSGLLAPPTMAGYKGPSKWEQIGSGLGIGGNILGSVLGNLPKSEGLSPEMMAWVKNQPTTRTPIIPGSVFSNTA